MNHVNLQESLIQRSCWWALSRESCKFTGFSTRGPAVGVLTGNHVNLQDSQTKGQAGGLSAGNHVNLQDSPPEDRLLEC